VAVPRLAFQVAQLPQNTSIACGFDQKPIDGEVLLLGVYRSGAGVQPVPESMYVHVGWLPRHGYAEALMQSLQRMDVSGFDISDMLDTRRRTEVAREPVVQRKTAILMFQGRAQRTCVAFIER
jgi:hypothetical protein